MPGANGEVIKFSILNKTEGRAKMAKAQYFWLGIWQLRPGYYPGIALLAAMPTRLTKNQALSQVKTIRNLPYEAYLFTIRTAPIRF